MSLWTPYLEEPMDLTRQKPAVQAGALDDWQFLREASTGTEYSDREYSHRESSPGSHIEYSRRESSPGSHRETSSPASEPGPEEDPEYQQFERAALSAMSGGRLLQHNPRMRRHIQGAHDATSDEQYRRQRQRNNVAAKMSRDRRKLREVRLAIQVAFLANKLQQLRARLAEQSVYEPPYTACQ